MLDPVDRVEVVDRYSVKFLLKEPFVWLVNVLANPTGTWIIPREVVEQHGDLKKAEHAIGTGPSCWSATNRTSRRLSNATRTTSARASRG